MATKTMILKPIDTDRTGLTPFPSDTDTLDYPLLIAEDIADDDATYLSSTSALAGTFYFVPDLNITPLNIRIVARMRTTILDSLVSIGYYADFNYTSSSAILERFDDINLSEEYITYIETVPTEHISRFFDYKTADGSSMEGVRCGIVNFSVGTTKTGSKATMDYRLTQLYLEIDYNDDNDNEELVETVYLKENGSWIAIPCSSIYQKQNGQWIIADSSIFEKGNKFMLQIK
jgi:hypothetical protein